jgi:hypothetical protein
MNKEIERFSKEIINIKNQIKTQWIGPLQNGLPKFKENRTGLT